MPTPVATLETSGSWSNASSGDTPSVTPPANRLNLMFITGSSGSVIPNPTVTGGGGTWELQAEANGATNRRRAFAFRMVTASPTTGALTIDFGGTSVGNVIYAYASYDANAEAGNNGADGIIQTIVRNVTTFRTRTWLQLEDRLNQNALIGWGVAGQEEAMTPQNSWTELVEVQSGFTSSLITGPGTNPNEAAWTWTTSGHHLAIALEVAEVGNTVHPSPLQAVLLTDFLTAVPGAGQYDFENIPNIAANSWLVCSTSRDRNNSPSHPTVTSPSLTWTQLSVGNIDWETIASPDRRLSVFVAKAATAITNEVVNVDWGTNGGSQKGIIAQITGHDTGLSATAIAVQNGSDVVDSPATSMSVTLNAFADSRNGTLIMAHGEPVAWDYPEVGDGLIYLNVDEPTDFPIVAWARSEQPAVLDVLQATNQAMVAMEVAAQPAAGPSAPRRRMQVVKPDDSHVRRRRESGRL